MKYLGIKTPWRHFRSRLPKGWLPRTYCRGTPLPRRRHSDASWCSALDGEGSRPRWSSSTCSRIQRSSLRAEGRSRQAGSIVAAWGEILWA